MKRLALALSLAAIASASGCASGPAPYAEAVGAGPGYSQVLLGDARYAVAFRGNAKTPDAAVKQMLFYRAAELTIRDGYDVFRVTRQTAHVAGGAQTQGAQSFEPTMSRAYAHNLFGYISSLEWSVAPPLTQTQHYEAEIEIVLAKGKVPPAPGVFDAREVIAALKDHIPAH